ncbi:hypothetical protein JW905_03145 [bacterium]|nr:hypothetical protein [candidate division CSSED10-310 bacterium]
MGGVVSFYIVVQLIHLAVLPIAWRLFNRVRDRGYGVAKLLGVVLLSYLSWIVPSLGLLPYSRGVVALMLLIIAGVSLTLFLLNRSAFTDFLRTQRKTIIWTETVFTGAFLLFVICRMYNPEISYDVNLYAAEKFPDMAFFHSIMRHEELPPPDLWFSGSENYINYYYYGYFVQATVAKLAGIDPWIAYNLALTLIFALSATGAFSLVYNFSGRRHIGLLAAVMLCIMGNLYGAVQMTSGQPFGPLEVWHGSRVIVKKTMVNNVEKTIDSTINEVPFFSFLLGDLHAHLLALPLSLLVLHFLALFSLVRKPLLRYVIEDRAGPWLLLLFLVAFGSLVAGNYWDLPTYTILAALILLLAGLQSERPLPTILSWEIYVGLVFMLSGGAATLAKAGENGGSRILAAFSKLFSLISPFAPFYRHYTAPPAEVAWVPTDQRSALGQFLTIHGFLFFLMIAMAVTLVAVYWKRNKMASWVTMVAPVVVSLGVFIAMKEPTAAMLAGLLVLCGILLLRPDSEPSPRFMLGLCAMALAVLLGCEFIYIKDFYGHPNERMNTVFKFYYEAWIFLSLAGAYAYHYVSEKSRRRLAVQTPFQLAALVLFIASLIYPVKSVPIKCDTFKPVMGRPTLNGFAYIKERYPGDYKAIEWLRKNVQDSPVILEATGNPYSYHGRVSTMAGLPTILGWGNHESLWRDWSWAIIGPRKNDVRTIYKSLDVREAGTLLAKYNVSYVFVGSLENDEFYSYDQNGLVKFRNFCDAVYEDGETVIFRVREGVPVDQYPLYTRNPRLIVPKEQGRVVINEKGMKSIEGRQAVKIWGQCGEGNGQFRDPKDIAVDSHGNIYVADAGNHRIQMFDGEGRFIKSLGAGKGEQPGQFNLPTGVGVDGQDNLYVADTWNHRIQKFDPEGALVKYWGDGGQFWAPKDVVIDSTGTVYVVDTGYQRVHKFDADAHTIMVWGGKGDEPGKLFEPVGIALRVDRTLYVGDTANQRISVFDVNGVFQSNWYVIGWEEFFTEPFLAIEPTLDVLAATDSRHNRLEFFALNGEKAGSLVAVWEQEGAGSGEFRLPLGVAFMPDGHLLVVDSGNCRIQKFAPFEAGTFIPSE